MRSGLSISLGALPVIVPSAAVGSRSGGPHAETFTPWERAALGTGSERPLRSTLVGHLAMVRLRRHPPPTAGTERNAGAGRGAEHAPNMPEKAVERNRFFGLWGKKGLWGWVRREWCEAGVGVREEKVGFMKGGSDSA